MIPFHNQYFSPRHHHYGDHTPGLWRLKSERSFGDWSCRQEQLTRIFIKPIYGQQFYIEFGSWNELINPQWTPTTAYSSSCRSISPYLLTIWRLVRPTYRVICYKFLEGGTLSTTPYVDLCSARRIYGLSRLSAGACEVTMRKWGCITWWLARVTHDPLGAKAN